MHSRPPLTPGAPPAAAPWRSHPFCRASDIASQARARPFVKRSGRSALGFAPPPDRGVSPGPSGVLLRRVPGVRTGAPGQPGQHGETPDHDRRGLPVGARRLLSLPSHPNRRQSGLGPLSSGPRGSAGAPCRPQETSRDVEGPSRLRRAGPSVWPCTPRSWRCLASRLWASLAAVGIDSRAAQATAAIVHASTHSATTIVTPLLIAADATGKSALRVAQVCRA